MKSCGPRHEILPPIQATEARVLEAKTFLKVIMKTAYEQYIGPIGDGKKRNFQKMQFCIVNTIGKKEGRTGNDQVMT
jgi:hypothetical protein